MPDLEITGRGLLVAHDWLLEREGGDAAANFLRALIQGKKWMLQGSLVRRLHGTGAGLQPVVMRVYRTGEPARLAQAARDAAAVVRREAAAYAGPDEKDARVRWRVELAAQELGLIADAAALLARHETQQTR